MGIDDPTGTSKIWWPLVDAGFMRYDDYKKKRACREFYIAPEVLRDISDAIARGRDRSTRYDLVSGKRKYGSVGTRLTYDGEHSWSQRSEFVYESLKTLQGQRDLVNKRAVEKHLNWREKRRDEAEARYERLAEACRDVKNQILEEGRSLTEQEKQRLGEAREHAYRAARAYQKEQARFDQDDRIWSDIRKQDFREAEDQPEGIFEYETTYEVQEKSGRVTMTIGLQNASEEMKAAACKGIPDYHNKDIQSSQTEALIQEMVDANKLGADLDVEVLTDYVGKDTLADRFGIDRDLWKRPEHGGKFGAMFNQDTYEEALSTAKQKVIRRLGKDESGDPNWDKLSRLEFESGEMAWQRAVYNALPTMARTARDWADDEEIDYEDPEQVYSILQDAFGEMTEEIDQWREWLVNEHWSIKGRHGSRHGYYVENPCGLAFTIHDYDDHYDKKAAYATSRLQGREAAYVLSLSIIAEDYDYELLRNEHDGAVVIGEIPEKARERAREMSGFRRAELEEKPFEGRTTDTDLNSKDSPSEAEQSQVSTAEKSNTMAKRGRSTGPPNPQPKSRSGARADRPPSGPPNRSPNSSRSETDRVSGTVTDNSSTGRGAGSNSGRAPTGSNDSTSRRDPVVKAHLEKRRKIRDGEVSSDLQEAIRQGFTQEEYRLSERNRRLA